MEDKEILKTIENIERLKERDREGWKIRGLPRESVADHITGTALFSLLLCSLIKEKINEQKVLKYSILHDYPESEVSDLDKISKKYIDKNSAEKESINESPTFLKEPMKGYFSEDSIEKKVVEDADKLDMLNRAYKLKKIGYSNEILKDFYRDISFNFEQSSDLLDLIESD